MKQAICIVLLALLACTFGFECNPGVGLANQAETCSPGEPCVDLLPNYILEGIFTIESPQFTGYECRNTHHNDGVPQTVTINGNERLYCQSYFETEDLLPLIVFLHPNGEDLLYPYTETNIRNHAANFNLNPAISSNGYVFVSVNALNRHWPIVNGSTGQDGSNFDYIFRDYEANEDFQFLDVIIDNYVNVLGVVDPRRIHLIGAANGGFFAQAYALHRSNIPTANGNTVASVAIYSAANPFGPIAEDSNCELSFYPTSSLPILLISRDCDVVSCGDVNNWVNHDLPEKILDAAVRWVLLNSDGHEVSSCASSCDSTSAAINHATWPITWENDILDFLKFSVSVPLSPNPEGPVPQFQGNYTFSDYFSSDPWSSFIPIPFTSSTIIYYQVSGVEALLPTLALLVVMFFAAC